MNMNDDSRVNETAETEPTETDLVSVLKKMQQQLNFLEKKIDVLISQSQAKPFGERTSSERPFRKRPFSKPPRSFDRPRPHNREERESSPRERDSSARHFYDRYSPAKKRGANPNAKKKPYYSQRKDRE
jgi:hypothetical protein